MSDSFWEFYQEYLDKAEKEIDLAKSRLDLFRSLINMGNSALSSIGDEKINKSRTFLSVCASATEPPLETHFIASLTFSLLVTSFLADLSSEEKDLISKE